MNHRPPSDDTPDSERYLRDTADSFFFDLSSGIHKPKAYEHETKRNEEAHIEPPSWQFWVTTIVSTLTLIAVAVYAYYAALQFCQMIRAANATQQAADAASRSATTAENTLKSSQQLFRTAQRPYIWAATEAIGHNIASPSQSIVLVPLQNGGYRIGWIVTFFNGGQSPAKDEVPTIAVTHATKMDKFAKEVASFVPRYEEAGQIAPPQVKFVARGDSIDITHDQYVEFMDRKLAIYVIGAIKYRDIFEPSITPYETRYCFALNPVGFPYSPCPNGNSIK
jgi:hypothetical protein